MKYGDAVVLVLKTGDVTSRLNAIVLASSLHAPMTLDRKPVPDAEVCEHLDIAFPVASLVPDGGILKTRNMDEIFRPAYNVGPYVDGAAIGFELASIRTAEGFELPPLGELKSSESLIGSGKQEVPVYAVPLSQLIALSNKIISYGPASLNLEISPDATVPSASELIEYLGTELTKAKAKTPVADISKVQLPDPNKQKELDHQLGGGLHANDDGGDGSGDEGGQRDGGEAGGGKQNPPPPGP